MIASAIACTNTPTVIRQPDSVAPTTSAAPVDPMRALALTPFVTQDYVHAHGSCLPTAGTSADRSRLLYVLLPNDTAYFRLNVVTSSDGSRLEMIDFVRKAGGRRIWSATLERRGGAGDAGALVMRTFRSQNDATPAVARLTATSPESEQLQALARAATQGPCAAR